MANEFPVDDADGMDAAAVRIATRAAFPSSRYCYNCKCELPEYRVHCCQDCAMDAEDYT